MFTKYDAIISLSNTITKIKHNATREKNLITLIRLIDKYIDDDECINTQNCGTMAELVVIKMLRKFYPTKEIKAHENAHDHYDVTIDGKKAEIKCCLYGESNALKEPHTMYVLATHGLHKINVKNSKKLVGKRIGCGDVSYNDLMITTQGLIEM